MIKIPFLKSSKTKNKEMHINIMLNSSMLINFSFCIEEMLISEQITNDAIAQYLDKKSVIEPAQNYIHKILQKNKYKNNTEEEKQNTVKCSWPKIIIDTTLLEYGLDYNSLSQINRFSLLNHHEMNSLNDKIKEFSNKFYQIITSHMKYNPGEINEAIVYEAAKYGIKNYSAIEEKPFKEWFPQAIAKLPRDLYDEAFDNNTIRL